MNIKTFLLSSFLIALGFTATAQSKSKVSFGFRGGFDYQTFNGKNQAGNELNVDMVPRFNAGLVLEIPLAKEFVIQPALLYKTKGARSDDNYLGLNLTNEINIAYIELPVNFVYKPTVGKGNLLLGFGPYIAYGVKGEVQYNVDGNTSDDKIEFTDEYTSTIPFDQKYFKPLDYGGNILFGYQFSRGFSAQLNAQLGLAQIRSDNKADPTNKAEFRNTGFGISLGYMF